MANSGTAGYIAPGSASVSSVIRKLTFSNDSIATISALTHSAGVNGGTGFANSGTAGYFAGGRSTTNPSFYLSDITKLQFSNDTRSTISGVLPQTNSWLGIAAAKSGTAAYIASGRDGNEVTSVWRKHAFSNDTQSTLAFALQATQLGAFANSGTL